MCAPAYILAIVAMIGASQLGNRGAVMLWLIGLHLVMGATIAGVTLASTNIALKLSPKGSATAYVAANAMTTAVAAGIAPILGGLLAQFFAARRFALVARWQSPNGVFTLPITLTAWDFYFLLAGLIASMRSTACRWCASRARSSGGPWSGRCSTRRGAASATFPRWRGCVLRPICRARCCAMHAPASA